METEKLYYADPFQKEFTATVLSCEESKKVAPDAANIQSDKR